MDEKLKDLVVAANNHSMIVCGEPLCDDMPDEDSDVREWCQSKTSEQLIGLVTEYLTGTI